MAELKINATDALMFYPDGKGGAFALHYTKGKSSWDAPKPLSKDDLKELLVGQAAPPNILPHDVLWYEEDKVMFWYSPPRKQTLRLSRENDMIYNHPGLVFRVHRSVDGKDKLGVAVVKSPFNRDWIAQPIYESPYGGHDVNPRSGNVGICKVSTPHADFSFCLEGGFRQWEYAFYDSQFNQRPRRRNHLKPTETTLIEWVQNETHIT